ncbi:Oidioi.mRNA.OKI2018_I69.XSR.g13903.t1.cds [Oikopleura dioica]|uniref:Oidioi.mRNA.OKI2018_I69.XSR.g13903.t1.cds n=1 Tax=Oikopleura dioica TaxID=34765 RepID=A0ABN7S892_OIKDI|nr:Oidioi.mRNA.OKI2018_I69.XSR.g13903.t1.cds [Oikopleura dioica]
MANPRNYFINEQIFYGQNSLLNSRTDSRSVSSFNSDELDEIMGSDYQSMSDQSEVEHSSNGTFGSGHFDEKDLDVEIMEDSISSNTESGRYDEHYDRDIECELFGNEHDTSEDSF